MTAKKTRDKVRMMYAEMMRFCEDTEINELEEDELEDIIKEYAGSDPRTIKKYTVTLVEEGYVEPIPHTHPTRYQVNEGAGGLQVDKGEIIREKDKVTTTVKIPRGVKNELDKFGLSMSSILTEAALDKLGVLEDVIVSMSSANGLNASESEYVMALIHNDLYRRYADKAVDLRKSEPMRQELYQKYIDRNIDESHKKALMQVANEFAQTLGMESGMILEE